MRKITIVGTGYVGLVHGATLADKGNQVVCLDVNHKKINSLKGGVIPFYEPGLTELVAKVRASGHLSFTDNYQEAIPGTDICFMCLPTPSNEDGSCDLSFLLSATKQVAESMENDLIVVNKSTVPMGTAAKVGETIHQTLTAKGSSLSFDVVSNPEFLREGSAVADSMHPNRILLGVESERASSAMHALYASFSVPPEKLLTTDIITAELAKYAANTMLASRISWMNVFSQLCDNMGGNIEGIRKAIGEDERIGPSYLCAGLGFGGSCLPKDVKALRHCAESQGIDTSMLDSVLNVNARQRDLFFEKIESHFGSLEGRTIAIWGLSFKPNTDDLREAPSLDVIQRCLQAGAKLRLYDPVALPAAQEVLDPENALYFAQDEQDAATGADAIALLTEWDQFQQVDFGQIGPLMKEKVLFDGRNHLFHLLLDEQGFDYFPIGIPHLQPHLVNS